MPLGYTASSGLLMVNPMFFPPYWFFHAQKTSPTLINPKPLYSYHVHQLASAACKTFPLNRNLFIIFYLFSFLLFFFPFSILSS